MIFLSALLRQNIYDSDDRRIGVVRDVCVQLDETFPVVTAIVIRPMGNNDTIIPWSQIHNIEDAKIHLTVKNAHIAAYQPGSNELLLRRDILDKQIVDTQGFRVVKVNDLKLAQIKQTARLVGVDISLSGLLRRLGMQPVVNVLSHIVPMQIAERTITWNYVEPIQVVIAGGTGQLPAVTADAATNVVGAAVGSLGTIPKVQLNVSQSKLADLHPADIADILEQLNLDEAGAVLDRLDDEIAADTLNEVEEPRQSQLLNELDPERASDLLEKMAPDDAADILAEMPQAEAERLLSLMPVADSQPIRELLRYGDETAGGIMTTEVLTLSQETTAQEALTYLRTSASHLEMVYYLYITDEEKHLKGVVSLRQLVTADSGARMADLLDPDVIRVQTTTDQEEVARIIARYDLFGVPVVDGENRLVGLVTVDDVIDVIHEEQAEDLSEIAGADVEEAEEEPHFSWRTALTRFSWMAVNVAAGFILALIVEQIIKPLIGSVATPFMASIGGMASTGGIISVAGSPTALTGIICLAPMLLLTSGRASAQTLGVVGWQLRSERGNVVWRGLIREIQLGTAGGILTSIIVGLLTWLLFHSVGLGIAIGLGFGCTLLIASICGVVLPNLLQRLRLRGSLIADPLLDPIIAVISLSSFFVVALFLIDRLHV